jgi:hypothetical protein
MEPATVTFHVVSLLISLLAPLAVVAVAILVLRRRQSQGWLLIASGAGLQFLAAGAIPVINYMLTLTAARLGTEALARSASDTAAVGLMGSMVSALGVGLLIFGILRLTRTGGEGK